MRWIQEEGGVFSVWARWSGQRQHRFLPAWTVQVQGVDNTLSGEGRCRAGLLGKARRHLPRCSSEGVYSEFPQRAGSQRLGTTTSVN